MNTCGEFFSFWSFRAKFLMNVPFSTHHGEINTIPCKWKSFVKKNGLTELQNVMHNKSFFVRHIYSRILKTILEPPSVGDKIFRHGFSKLNVHKIYLLLFIIGKDVCWWCLYTEFITYFLSQTCFGTESDSVFCSLGKTEKKP